MWCIQLTYSFNSSLSAFVEAIIRSFTDILLACVYIQNGIQNDLLYTVDTSGSGVRVVLTEVTGTETTVMGLTPAVYYTFLVTSENGVSSQDTNIGIRSANVTATTEEGGICIQS